LSNYNQYCIIENDERLLFAPNKINEIKFQFLPHQHDIGKDLEVNQISLELGNREKRVLVMYWKGDCRNALSHENQTLVSFSKKISFNISLKDNDKIDWNSITNISSARF
jgi:hypothetical protein